MSVSFHRVRCNSDSPQSPADVQSSLRAPHSPLGESSLPQGAFLLLLPYRAPKTIEKHPEVAAWRRRGWRVKSVEERLVEGKGTRLLVTLYPADAVSADGVPQSRTDAAGEKGTEKHVR